MRAPLYKKDVLQRPLNPHHASQAHQEFLGQIMGRGLWASGDGDSFSFLVFLSIRIKLCYNLG